MTSQPGFRLSIGGEGAHGPLISKTCGIVCAIVMVGAAAIAIGVYFGVFHGKTKESDEESLSPPNPSQPLMPSTSRLHIFKKAAVCADATSCAKIGKDIFEKNGSAVDAAIAALFCNGIINMHSMGLGGGFFMTIYIKQEGRAYALNAREFAPINATSAMYRDDPKKSKRGPLAVGVPGELKGYWEAHQRFGKLQWKEVVQPAIELCEKGYNMTKAQYDALIMDKEIIKTDDNLKRWFVNDDGTFRETGALIKPDKLCKTLKLIAETDGLQMHNGSLTKIFVEDIQEIGGVITVEDMKNYTVQWLEPVHTQFRNGDNFYSTPLPGGGVLLAFILNILDGYQFNSRSLNSKNLVQTYQRTVEAFKYAFARRGDLGDIDFVKNISHLVTDLTSLEFANTIRTHINDTGTNNDPKAYGGVFVNNNDHGTAHISILAANGDAVSVTSTVNLYFGAGITSKRTGILLNSGMDDFSFAEYDNFFHLPYSWSNRLEPMKRPLSSMSPSIITDKDGEVKLVIGASGGTKIISAIVEVIMRILWCNQNIKEAVDAPRYHHQLYPMELQYEFGTVDDIVKALQKLGHKTARFNERGSIVCAILKKDGNIFANADFRKGGDVYGIN